MTDEELSELWDKLLDNDGLGLNFAEAKRGMFEAGFRLGCNTAQTDFRLAVEEAKKEGYLLGLKASSQAPAVEPSSRVAEPVPSNRGAYYIYELVDVPGLNGAHAWGFADHAWLGSFAGSYNDASVHLIQAARAQGLQRLNWRAAPPTRCLSNQEELVTTSGTVVAEVRCVTGYGWVWEVRMPVNREGREGDGHSKSAAKWAVASVLREAGWIS
jgi:hypothetical protein